MVVEALAALQHLFGEAAIVAATDVAGADVLEPFERSGAAREGENVARAIHVHPPRQVSRDRQVVDSREVIDLADPVDEARLGSEAEIGLDDVTLDDADSAAQSGIAPLERGSAIASECRVAWLDETHCLRRRVAGQDAR
jgi:hypothetical protein